jgi:hypothetical protein
MQHFISLIIFIYSFLSANFSEFRGIEMPVIVCNGHSEEVKDGVRVRTNLTMEKVSRGSSCDE